ncbi:hypothetical protein BJV74DRAFT_961036, partial [Russula compacta]
RRGYHIKQPTLDLLHHALTICVLFHAPTLTTSLHIRLLPLLELGSGLCCSGHWDLHHPLPLPNTTGSSCPRSGLCTSAPCSRRSQGIS